MNNKIIARITYFTDNGEALAAKLQDVCSKIIFQKKNDEEISEWIKDCFNQRMPIVFIGAAGIAVRIISPFVTNKLTDVPVIVIDELGQNVIPILSGHYGGANEIAKYLAKQIGANPVITTATDINQVFAIDTFARENGLKIASKDGIKAISSKALKGETIKVRFDVDVESKGTLPKVVELTDSKACDVVVSDKAQNVFTLIPKKYVLGMGCKKDKSFKELLTFITKEYSIEFLRENLYAIATVDLKADEPGLIQLAQYLGAKFITFSSDELSKVNGDFAESEFVKETVGVSNVCERAAVLGAGHINRELELEKIAENGMTMATAKIKKLTIDWNI